MIILSPLEPWPGELVLDAAAAHDVERDHARGRLRRRCSTTTCCPGHAFAEHDHRKFRPDGLGARQGREKLERMRPYAERHGLTMLQLACLWNLAQPAGALRRADADPGERRAARAPIEDKRAELAAVARAARALSAEEVARAARDRRQHAAAWR